jgi:hypothetical protein
VDIAILSNMSDSLHSTPTMQATFPLLLSLAPTQAQTHEVPYFFKFRPPLITRQSICAAVNACATFSRASNYYTFNLQYMDAIQSWYCVSYVEQAIPGDYNFDTPGVSQSYGFVVDLS